MKRLYSAVRRSSGFLVVPGRFKVRYFIKFNVNTLTIVGTDEMLKDEDDSRVDDPGLAQTLTTVLQIGLVGLLRYLGVHPVATLGHSMGEIAAA
jgi:malonyl CoA-acyl carrier protein transacylase